MRPTFSIIFFTVASGAGYGLWILSGWLSLLAPRLADDRNAWAATDLVGAALCAGFLLVSAGLCSSLAHLGQPQRAWRALSQWRSSWLSREGVAALLCYLPAGTMLLACILGGWATGDGSDADRAHWLLRMAGSRGAGGILLLLAIVTLFCTANIYASLKPIRAWHNRFVVPTYLVLGIYSGALWVWLLSGMTQSPTTSSSLLIGICSAAVAAGVLKLGYWHFLDKPAPQAPDATGLGALGTVRSVEQPHTEENYLTHEMGFRLARKHARKLRALVLALGFGMPALLAVLALVLPAAGAWASWLAVLFGMGGIFIERWLFFAEAKHVVMLFYGARSG
jgi:DMSO reductase anchor subunit